MARSDSDALLLRLTLQVLEGAERQGAAEEDNGVEANARGCAVCG